MNRTPYQNTTIDPEHSKADIEHILKLNGIKDVQWTTLDGKTELKFLWVVTAKGVERKIAFGFSPPDIIMKHRRQGYGTVSERDERVAFRMLFFYLKSKLEAVKYGLESLEQEFMSHILMSLPDGSSRKLGERLEEAIVNGYVESTFALPAPRESQRKVIEQ